MAQAKSGTGQSSNTSVPQDWPEENGPQAEVVRRINPAQYREITSFDQALALARETYGTIEAASAALGDGFELIDKKDKGQFVGVPFVILSFSFAKSEVGSKGEFVSMRIVTDKNRKAVLNDGGAGIYEQLREYRAATGRDGGLYVGRGLRVSEYDYETGDTDENGEPILKEAKTYYLDTAA
ncbi:MAG TPA: hypothetical protein VFI97_03560 [Arthrobacter sp.]|nr:hypothetical protein [Arthrobacter sp.]